MNKLYFRRGLSLLLILLASCCLLSGCTKTKQTASIESFKSACESDKLTASDRKAEDPNGEVADYAAYEHGTENILVEFYQFHDTDTAVRWYQARCEAVNPSPSATTYEMTGNNFLSYTVTADKAYTVITQVEDTMAVATGPLQYKSELDRLMLSIGYLSSNL